MDKSPDAFRTISEVAEELSLPQHVLRFWESKFPEIRPMKRAGGRRYYRPDDVDLLRGIKHLLYTECYRIEGVQGILRDREKGRKFVQAVWQPGAVQPTSQLEGESIDEASVLGPDEAARALFGLLKSSPPKDGLAGSGDPGEVDRESTPPSTAASLTLEHIRRLQGALHELSECRQLIEQVLKDEAA